MTIGGNNIYSILTKILKYLLKSGGKVCSILIFPVSVGAVSEDVNCGQRPDHS